MRSFLALVVVLALGLAAAPTRAAAPQRLASALGIADPVIAGEATFYGQTDVQRFGSVVTRATYSVKSLAPGGPARTVTVADASSSSTIDETDTYAFSFAASPNAVAVLNEARYETGVAVHWEDWLYSGAHDATLTLALHCEDNGSDAIRPTVPFALDGSRLAYVFGSCPPQEPQQVIDGTAKLSVPAGQTVDALAVAGDFLAYSVTGDDFNHPFHRVVVARVSTGSEAYHVDVPGSGAIAVAPDGTVAFAGYDHLDQDCARDAQLGWASLAEPAVHTIAGAAPCSPRLALAGGRIGYLGTDRQLHSTDLAGHDVALLGNVSSFAMAADRAVAVLPDCNGQALYELDAIDAAAPAPAGVSALCGVHLRSRHLTLQRRTLRVRISCPHGCNGTADISPSRNGHHGLGAQPFALPAGGRRTVVLSLSRRAAGKLAGRRRAYVILSAPVRPGQLERTRPVRVSLSSR